MADGRLLADGRLFTEGSLLNIVVCDFKVWGVSPQAFLGVLIWLRKFLGY